MRRDRTINRESINTGMKMKKLTTLIILILLSTGLVFAQNNEASVDQIGDDNVATATQTGLSHDATIEQLGDDNNSTITQTFESNNGTNRQFGNDNLSTTVQAGNSNQSWTVQGWYNEDAAHDNISSVTQNGNDNYTVAYTFYGNFNSVSVNQESTDNVAYVMQGWSNPDDYVNDNNAIISQFSSDNDARIFQYNGDNNTATVTQQGGNDNNGQISQGYLWAVHDLNIAEAFFSEGNIVQNGDQNNATVMQFGDSNFFDLVQNSSGNVVGEEGSVSQGAKWFIQDGDRNQFAGVINSGGLSFTNALSAEQNNGSTLDYETEGISGYYGSFQFGDDNKIGLRQGQDDWGLIQQLGNDNTALLSQSGSGGNSSTILQHGNNNSSSVIQTNN